MASYKRNLFVKACKLKKKNNPELTYEQIVEEYTNLTDEEKQEILDILNGAN